MIKISTLVAVVEEEMEKVSKEVVEELVLALVQEARSHDVNLKNVRASIEGEEQCAEGYIR